VQEDGTDAMRDRLADQATFDRAARDLSHGFYGGIEWHWDRVVISSGPPDAVGRNLQELAEESGVAAERLVLDLCCRYGNAVQAVLFYRSEEDVREFVAHPLSLIGSDGNALPLEESAAKPHPRSFGTYPRVLCRHVDDVDEHSLETMIDKMSSGVADRIGLSDRGRLVPGHAADMVVFDPVGVADAATYLHPFAPPRGIRHVIVNGRVAVRDGELTGIRAGEVLRHHGRG